MTIRPPNCTKESLLSVVIIDPATGGAAGLYLDAYKNVARKYGGTLIGACSSISTEGKRYFYPYTDLAAGGKKRFGRLRLPLRYIELVAALARSFLFIVSKRPKAVFYALSSNLTPELMFVLLLRMFRVPVYVICHDVVPFVAAHENRKLKDLQRQQFYRFADKLICHNRRSVDELTQSYGIDAGKIEYIPFPISDLRKFPSAERMDQPEGVAIADRGPQFLFVGHVRAEKGVNVLVGAWRRAFPAIPDARLLIAGQVPRGVEIKDADSTPGLTVKDSYIEEAAYVRLINESDCVVLPYLAGTNSAILSNVVSLGKPSIVSDIEMFRECGLVAEDAMFRSQDEEALAAKLVEYASLSPVERRAKSAAVEQIRDNRVRDFDAALDQLLSRISAT